MPGYIPKSIFYSLLIFSCINTTIIVSLKMTENNLYYKNWMKLTKQSYIKHNMRFSALVLGTGDRVVFSVLIRPWRCSANFTSGDWVSLRGLSRIRYYPLFSLCASEIIKIERLVSSSVTSYAGSYVKRPDNRENEANFFSSRSSSKVENGDRYSTM